MEINIRVVPKQTPETPERGPDPKVRRRDQGYAPVRRVSKAPIPAVKRAGAFPARNIETIPSPRPSPRFQARSPISPPPLDSLSTTATLSEPPGRTRLQRHDCAHSLFLPADSLERQERSPPIVAPLAQLAEQLTLNQRVSGSSPEGGIGVRRQGIESMFATRRCGNQAPASCWTSPQRG